MNAFTYPKRPKCFAFKFCRLLAKKTVANDIGSPACWLLTVIAMTEDARGYTDPVTFYNEQLLPLIGVGSVDALDRVRAKCIASGWLQYEPGARGRAGRYFVTVPSHCNRTDDAPTDEGEGAELFRENAEESADDRRRFIRKNAEATARNVRKQPRGNRGTLFPVPSPIPIAGHSPAEPTPETKEKTKKPRKRNPLFDVLVMVTGADPVVNGSHVGRVAALLSKAERPFTPEEVHDFAHRWRQLLPWAKPSEHPRLTLGIIEKHICTIRDSPEQPNETPRVKTAAEVLANQDTDFAPMGG